MSSSVPRPVDTPAEVIGDGLRLIGRLIRDQPVVYAVAAAGAIAFTSAIIASAVVIGHVTDDLIIPVLDEGQAAGPRLRSALLLILGVAVWKATGIVLRRATAGWLQFTAQSRIRKRLIAHQLGLSLHWYGGRSTGDLLSVADNDARQATFVLAPLPFATGVVFLVFGAVTVITLTDPWLGAAAAALLLIVIAIDMRGAWLTFEEMQELQRRRGDLGDKAHESFDGALTVKSLGREEFETARFAVSAEALADQFARVGKTWTGYRAITDTLPALGSALILLLAIHRVAEGAVATGEIVRVVYLLSLMSMPIKLIGFLMWDAANSVAGSRRVEEVLQTDDAVPYGVGTKADAITPAPVTGRGLTFGYRGAPVLKDLQLEVPAGRTLAVVGPTGAGKSSLTLLLARLWDPDAGAVELDGRDLRDLAPGVVPSEVAYVAQDTFLFDDTVLGNLTLGADVPFEQVEDAVRLAGADGFIANLPQGYDTPLGERGTTLSGGQRQRIALARALVRRPRVLVLDDATSALDPSVEAAILRRLRDAALPATVVLVAYRRSSIVLADEVAYVEDGRVVAHGPHEELLASEPGYARLLTAYEVDAARRTAERAEVQA
ncbi:MAG: ABC transporter ATP-binding protein/permease [Actinobacteria bacterium]|nr:ABC transporter ATP-binding protein/permease [Actinomycetota bacterium]